MNGLTLQNKVSKVLARLNATARVVSLRTVYRAGGNAVLGTGQTLTNVDTVLDPQPAVEQVTADEVLSSSGGLQYGDFRVTMPGTITEETLGTSELLYGDDVLKIMSWMPASFAGVVIAWSVIARTTKLA